MYRTPQSLRCCLCGVVLFAYGEVQTHPTPYPYLTYVGNPCPPLHFKQGKGRCKPILERCSKVLRQICSHKLHRTEATFLLTEHDPPTRVGATLGPRSGSILPRIPQVSASLRMPDPPLKEVFYFLCSDGGRDNWGVTRGVQI